MDVGLSQWMLDWESSDCGFEPLRKIKCTSGTVPGWSMVKSGQWPASSDVCPEDGQLRIKWLMSPPTQTPTHSSESDVPVTQCQVGIHQT